MGRTAWTGGGEQGGIADLNITTYYEARMRAPPRLLVVGTGTVGR